MAYVRFEARTFKKRGRRRVNTAKAAASTVGRVIDLLARPGLEVEAVQRAVIRDVFCSDALNGLEDILVLADTAYGDAKAPVEDRVCDENVGGIGLGADAVVAVDDRPVAEGDVRTVDGIGSVGIVFPVSLNVIDFVILLTSRVAVGGRAVHID
jgi:hypothetical protein